MADDNDDEPKRGDHTGVVVLGGLVVAGGALTALILLNRGKSTTTLCPDPNLILEDSATGALLLVDDTQTLHPISAAGIATCKYCTDSAHKFSIDDPTFQSFLSSCTVGPPVPDAGPCPPGPVCSTGGDPWPAWWASHHPGDGARESVSIYYDLFGMPPQFDGDNTYPFGVWLVEAGGQGCAAPGTRTRPLTPLEGVSWRIISDCACGFFNRVDKAAGGPGCGCSGGSFGKQCYCNSDSACGAVAFCEYPTTPAQHEVWLSAAGTIIFGSPYSATALDAAQWLPTSPSTDICNQGTSGWQHATFALITHPAYAQRIAAQAAASLPPWEGGAAAAGFVIPGIYDSFVPSTLHAADLASSGIYDPFVPSTLHAAALAGGARLGPGSTTPHKLETASGII